MPDEMPCWPMIEKQALIDLPLAGTGQTRQKQLMSDFVFTAFRLPVGALRPA